MKNLFILAGPTAVGKTDISIKLAEKLNGEIISADSMQIYKYMDIGSAKVKELEMKGIPHYMLDIVDPMDSYNVSQFKKEAEKIIDDILNRGKLPMLVGGTGLYINSLICNYEFTEAKTDEEYRNFLVKLAEEKGKGEVHSLLKAVDRESFERLFPNDLKRVIRALEVYKLTGKTISEYNDSNDIYDIPYNIAYFVLTMNREVLYERINKRVDIMLESGLLEEVKELKLKGYSDELQAMKGIGYKELLYYLKGDISYEEAVYLIKKGSRNYAKRQLTWFRKDPRVTWIDKDLFNSEKEIVEDIYEKTQKLLDLNKGF